MGEIELPQGTIRYRDTGAGEPVVFVHGYAVDGRLWERVVPRLEGDVRCVVPDWPLGSHRVAMAPGADLSARGVARLVADVIAALGLDSVTLVGNDTGGALSQVVAAEHPERLARLVLTPCDAFENFPPKLFRPLKLAARVPGGLTAAFAPMRVQAARRLPFAYGWTAKHRLPGELLEHWVRPFLSDRGVRRDTVKVTRGLDAGATLDAAAGLVAFDRPALVAFAPEDRFFPFEHGRRLATILPRGRLEAIEDSWTFAPLDQPERTATLIGDFIRSTPLSPR